MKQGHAAIEKAEKAAQRDCVLTSGQRGVLGRASVPGGKAEVCCAKKRIRT
jgi:hypothetical protein